MKEPRQQSFLDELRMQLTDAAVRAMQVIQLALAGGVLIFGVVVGVLHVLGTESPDFEPMPSRDGELALPMLLSLIHATMFVMLAAMSPVLYATMLSRTAGATEDASNAERARAAVQSLRAARLVRLALLEGPALFGLVVAMLGVLRHEPVYLWNALSGGLFVAYALATLPTKPSLVEELEHRFRGA